MSKYWFYLALVFYLIEAGIYASVFNPSFDTVSKIYYC